MSAAATSPARFWDRHARGYARRPIKDMAAYELTLERTRAYLAPGSGVLEIGCGTGTTALRLADAAGSIVATDVSPGMIGIARDKLAAEGVGNVRFEVAGIAEAPAGPHDAVLAFNLLHLLDDLDGALALLHARLRPGGMFVSKTPCVGSMTPLLRPVIWAMRQIGMAPRIAYLVPDSLEAAIRGAGFEIVEAADHPAGGRSRFVAARRPE